MAPLSVAATNYKPPRGWSASVTHALGQQEHNRSQGSLLLVDGTHPALRSPFLALAEAPGASQAPGSPRLLPLAPCQTLNEGVLERDLLLNKPTFHSLLPGSAVLTASGHRDKGPAPVPSLGAV